MTIAPPPQAVDTFREKAERCRHLQVPPHRSGEEDSNYPLVSHGDPGLGATPYRRFIEPGSSARENIPRRLATRRTPIPSCALKGPDLLQLKPCPCSGMCFHEPWLQVNHSCTQPTGGLDCSPKRARGPR